jgi:hypothetical protein
MTMETPKILGALAALATFSSAIAITYSQTAHAQTNGMERRDERRGTRQTSREVKHECKSGDKSNAECRQGKRDVKQAGRHDQTPTTNLTTNPPH